MEYSDFVIWHESHEMMEEMGFCPDCGDHMPCGCEGCDYDEWDDIKDLDFN